MIETFPKIRGFDSAKFGVSYENVVMRNKMENGLVQTRPRHTRSARRIYSIGFTDMFAEDKARLLEFWNSVKGGSLAFYWNDPTEDEVVMVRFGEGELNMNYTGAGGNHAWDCDGVILEEI